MTELPPPELFGFWRSSATFRVRVALALKGIEATEHIIDVDAGAQRDPRTRLTGSANSHAVSASG